MIRKISFILLGVCLTACLTLAQSRDLDPRIDQALPNLISIYHTIHSAPELSHYEAKTSALLAKQLSELGYTVTEHVGKYPNAAFKGYGVVAVMKNGAGPTVLVRTDLDALPVEEKTALAFASHVKMANDAGQEVPVMHACGHDIHITSLIGTARMLAALKDRWHGTLVLIGQPAEELGAGAEAMLSDNLYSRFPKPDYAVALHDTNDLPAGTVGYTPGYALASVDSVDILVRGVGGHGSRPEATKDPIVVAAQIVLALQTIVSRENSPFDPAVVTVGSIHGGTKNNIIPEEVRLQLTVRTYKEEVRQRILNSIARISRYTALAAGVPESLAPVITAGEAPGPATYNNPALTERLAAAFTKALGREHVVQTKPIMASEDFGVFGLEGHQIPTCIFWIGAADPAKYAESQKTGKPLPSLHSSQFAPDAEPTIRTGVKAMTSAVLELMQK
ncbi:MAG: amidohydrolase [Acidobacteriia bacterium]|nr:amidohydrolase [Terriglobia bacterium]